MKSCAQLVGKLPFAGKITLRPFIFGLYLSTTKERRRTAWLNLLALLIIFSLGHGKQVRMGIKICEYGVPVWVRAIGALYAMINASVILTQVYLAYRITRFYFRGPLPRMDRTYVEYSAAQTMTMTAVTLGGQILFGALYLWFRCWTSNSTSL